jgi:hypothetical protein
MPSADLITLRHGEYAVLDLALPGRPELLHSAVLTGLSSTSNRMSAYV